MQHNYLLTITLAIGLFLVGCADMGDKQTQGTVIGAGIGGTLGYGIGSLFGRKGKAIGAITGALAGGILGNQLGKYLDEQDYQNIRGLVADSKPQTQTWCSGSSSLGVAPSGCEGKNQVTVTTTPITMLASGQQCRDYTTEVQTPEGLKTVSIKACKDKDGNWKDEQPTAGREIEDRLNETT